MSNETEVQRFNKVFKTTLKNDSKNTFLKLPIDNYQQLAFFQNNIFNAIEIIAESLTETSTNEDTGFTIKALAQIGKKTVMYSECQGIDELQ